MASPIILDPWKIPKAISFGRPKSSVVAIITIAGPGGAGASGDPFPGAPTAFAKIGSALRYPAAFQALITLYYQAPSAEDGSRPSVTWDDLHNFKDGPFWPVDASGKPIVGGREFYIQADVTYANLLEKVKALGLSVTKQEAYVDLKNLEGGTSKGRWGVEFVGFGYGSPGYVDLTRSSSVIQVVPAPPPPLKPEPSPPPKLPDPNTVTFSVTSTASDPAEVANSNVVTVSAYTQTLATKDDPNPPAMKFTARDDGTIAVDGGTSVFSFSRSEPDLIAYSPGGDRPPDKTVVYKFNSKGLVS